MPRRAGQKKGKKGSSIVRVLFYTLFLGFLAIFASAIVLGYFGILQQTDFTVYASIAQSMLFSTVVIAYLLARGRNPGQIAADLGLSKRQLTKRPMLVLSLALFLLLAVIALEFMLAIFQLATGISLPTNVQQLFSGLPLYFLIFAVVVAPINEEILFRGFLVPRAGIVISALLFAGLHYLSYNSIAEFLAALVFGLLAGYVRKRYNSIYPSIIAHMAVNLIGLIALSLI